MKILNAHTDTLNWIDRNTGNEDHHLMYYIYMYMYMCTLDELGELAAIKDL